MLKDQLLQRINQRFEDRKLTFAYERLASLLEDHFVVWKLEELHRKDPASLALYLEREFMPCELMPSTEGLLDSVTEHINKTVDQWAGIVKKMYIDTKDNLKVKLVGIHTASEKNVQVIIDRNQPIRVLDKEAHKRLLNSFMELHAILEKAIAKIDPDAWDGKSMTSIFQGSSNLFFDFSKIELAGDNVSEKDLDHKDAAVRKAAFKAFKEGTLSIDWTKKVKGLFKDIVLVPNPKADFKERKVGLLAKLRGESDSGPQNPAFTWVTGNWKNLPKVGVKDRGYVDKKTLVGALDHCEHCAEKYMDFAEKDPVQAKLLALAKNLEKDHSTKFSAERAEVIALTTVRICMMYDFSSIFLLRYFFSYYNVFTEQFDLHFFQTM